MFRVRSLFLGHWVCLVVHAFFCTLSLMGVVHGSPAQGRPLPIGREEVAERHGMALQVVSRGALDAGILLLEALREEPKAAPLLQRIEKDIQRTGALRELRSRHFSELIEKQKKVTLERRGDKLTATVVSQEGGKLQLAGLRDGPKEIDADELALLPLVRGFSAKTLEGTDVSVRGYAFVLAGDTKGMAGLKGTPAAEELRKDAAEFYPTALSVGAAAELLSKLAELGTPKDQVAAAKVAETLEDVMRRFQEYELVSTRRPALATLGLAAYDLLFDPSKIEAGLSASVEHLPDGRSRYTYEFRKLRQVGDFTPEHEYLKDLTDRHKGPRAPARELVIEGGLLKIGGTGVWRHALEFEGSVAFHCTFAFDQLEDVPMVCFALNDDHADSAVFFDLGNKLTVRDIPSRLLSESPRIPALGFKRMQQLSFTLAVSEGVATVHEGPKERARVDCGPRTKGSPMILVAGKNDLLVSKLVIEGRVDAGAMRGRWCRSKLAALGL